MLVKSAAADDAGDIEVPINIINYIFKKFFNYIKGRSRIICLICRETAGRADI